MKLYTFYTPSHETLYRKWFLPTLQDDFEVRAVRYEQVDGGEQYGTSAFNTTMLHKVDLILEAIRENWGKIFVYADVDIQFFAPIEEDVIKLMEGYDMVIQKNSWWRGEVCAGFFAAVGNERTRKLWEDVRARLIDQETKHDQHILNELLVDTPSLVYRLLLGMRKLSRGHLRFGQPSYVNAPNTYGVKWTYLPDTYFDPGVSHYGGWSAGDDLSVPSGIKIHHANWTVGLENKVKQLKYVRNLVESRDGLK